MVAYAKRKDIADVLHQIEERKEHAKAYGRMAEHIAERCGKRIEHQHFGQYGSLKDYAYREQDFSIRYTIDECESGYQRSVAIQDSSAGVVFLEEAGEIGQYCPGDWEKRFKGIPL